VNSLLAAASCVRENVPCDDGGGGMAPDLESVITLVAVVVAIVVLFGVLLLGSGRRRR